MVLRGVVWFGWMGCGKVGWGRVRLGKHFEMITGESLGCLVVVNFNLRFGLHW